MESHSRAFVKRIDPPSLIIAAGCGSTNEGRESSGYCASSRVRGVSSWTSERRFPEIVRPTADQPRPVSSCGTVMKCMPMNLCGRSVRKRSRVIEIDEVFDAMIALSFDAGQRPFKAFQLDRFVFVGPPRSPCRQSDKAVSSLVAVAIP